MIKIALIEGPYLRPSGIKHWEELDKRNGFDIVAFESKPSRYDTSGLDLEVRQLYWPEGDFTILGYEHFFSRALEAAHFPSDYLVGIRKLTEEFDIIHGAENYRTFSLQAAIATRNTDSKFVFSAGENIPYPRKQRNPLMWEVKKYVNKRADGINTTTPFGKRALIHEGVDPEKVSVIPNCIDTDIFKPTQDINLSDTAIDEDLINTTNILFVHHLCQQKGVPHLLKAFADIREDYENLRLVLVGENDLSSDDKDLVEKHSDIVWIDSLPYQDMPKLYNICDIGVLPSVPVTNNEEQFGMAILEAMACGLPTVVTNVGGLPYVVNDKETSLVVPPRSPSKLAAALGKLIEDPQLRTTFGENGRDRAISKFGQEKVADKLGLFYKKIMGV
ncbi:MAG: glycosyltransferase family 4 protein [Halobacteriaceae archaeon]